MSLYEQVLNEISLYCRDECSSSQECPEDECVLFRIERLVMEEKISVDRAIELIKEMANYIFVDYVSGQQFLTNDEIINILFVIGFTEEEIMQLFDYTEDDIDSANATQEG